MPAAPPKPHPGKGSKIGNVPRWAWVAGATLLLVGGYLVYRHRSSSALTPFASSSGNPGPDLTGSAAQEPSGGAAGVPGNLPPVLVSQPPDPVTTQVQQTDTGAPSLDSGFGTASSGVVDQFGTPTPAAASTPILPAGQPGLGLILNGNGLGGQTDAQQAQAGAATSAGQAVGAATGNIFQTITGGWGGQSSSPAVAAVAAKTAVGAATGNLLQTITGGAAPAHPAAHPAPASTVHALPSTAAKRLAAGRM